MNIATAKSTLALCLCFLLIPASSRAEQTRVDELDSLLQKGRVDLLFRKLAPERFGEPSLPSTTAEEDMPWLQTRAKEGHVPLAYVYGYRLLNKDFGEALSWYAKGRIWAYLDAAECAVPTRTPWYNILELSFGEGLLHAARKKEPMVYLRHVDDTLRAEDARQNRPSAKWYCSIGQNENLLPSEEAMSARKKRASRLLEDNQKKIEAGRDD